MMLLGMLMWIFEFKQGSEANHPISGSQGPTYIDLGIKDCKIHDERFLCEF